LSYRAATGHLSVARQPSQLSRYTECGRAFTTSRTCPKITCSEACSAKRLALGHTGRENFWNKERNYAAEAEEQKARALNAALDAEREGGAKLSASLPDQLLPARRSAGLIISAAAAAVWGVDHLRRSMSAGPAWSAR
jgi:hypothetical protein